MHDMQVVGGCTIQNGSARVYNDVGIPPAGPTYQFILSFLFFDTIDTAQDDRVYNDVGIP